jgi:small subunit ribosomal protein S6
MKKYEATFIFTKENKKLAESIEAHLKAIGAKVGKKDDWGVKPLAYPIKKLTEAAYLYFEFETEPAKIKDLETKLKLEESLLRRLIVLA